MKYIGDLPVMEAQCNSCPFGPKSDGILARLVLSRIGLHLRQMCHHPRTKGKPETHLCRGAYDAQFAMFRERFK